MSNAFILMGLLVLAGFALGLLVGWLAWTSARPDPDRPARRPVRLRPMTRGLPDWEVEQGSNRVEWRLADPPADQAGADPTEADRTEVDQAAESDAGLDPASDPEPTVVRGPRSNGNAIPRNQP